ncbi:uncharacterized protein PV09_09609 [Verruconis gallopava]|uniref:AMP-dependent synthetase/ligase domain-containing protein n=1 Tax=Verruconis gallopava TaxID=253628 RepID=A0A0D1ZVX8_9PEZI|nr:uncharacterized protein PV09_09609 [Verruconis gallopava]KIV98617.1 hypothetical protein PV09_09609 [Verruconis gallopava]
MNDLQIQRGELIALDGPNSPEYIMILIAISAIGASAAYINNNLTANPLVHSVKLCEARYLLADSEVRSLVEPYDGEMREAGVQTVFFNELLISNLSNTKPIPLTRRKGINPSATLRLIYTSGTTGLPKGVKQSYGKELLAAEKISKHLSLKPGYVGELARYLLNAPPSLLDKQHNVHMAWGNGIRPDVWEPFRQRFGIETINEIYGATDGYGTTWNKNRGSFGATAVSVRGPLWHFWNGAREKRVLIDVDSEDILRGTNGFAIECKPGEPGECIHKIDPDSEALVFSKYYKDKAAGSKLKMFQQIKLVKYLEVLIKYKRRTYMGFWFHILMEEQGAQQSYLRQV